MSVPKIHCRIFGACPPGDSSRILQVKFLGANRTYPGRTSTNTSVQTECTLLQVIFASTRPSTNQCGRACWITFGHRVDCWVNQIDGHDILVGRRMRQESLRREKRIPTTFMTIGRIRSLGMSKRPCTDSTSKFGSNS
jgi:hypothetical protein